MFRLALGSTPFFDEASNDYFSGRVVGLGWNGDITFLSTLRALLDKRMPENAVINLEFSTTKYTADQLAGLPGARSVNLLTERFVNEENILHVHNFDSPIVENNTAWFRAMEKNFAKEGWRRVEKVTAFFHKVFDVLCFINPELKSTILFTSGMDMRKHHYLQCGIPAFMPWFFDMDKGVSPEEMALLNALREKDSGPYEEALQAIANRYDFRTARITALLKGFESRYEKIQLNNAKRELQSIMSDLASLEERIGDYLRRKRDVDAKLLGLEMKIREAGEDNEFLEYCLSHKNIDIIGVSDSTISFRVCTRLAYFDEDVAKRIIENDRSLLYRNYDNQFSGGQITPEEMKLLMTEVFLNQTLSMRVCAAYSISESNVSPIGGHSYPARITKTHMPNPHIDRYRCMGNHIRHIESCLMNGDYIAAVEQCVASAGSLNFADTTVMNDFVRKVYNFGGGIPPKFIEDEDGNLMTAPEAVAWIKERNAKKEEA